MAERRGDLGCSFEVHFLGSSALSRMSTGVGMLQKPLRDLYFTYQTPQGPLQLGLRRLVLTLKGMVISTSAMDNIFYSMESIVYWDSVQFVTVRGQDKKLRCAFEPLDNDHSRNKDNIFVDLDKKLAAYMTKLAAHPAIFTCILRRTSGAKALDLHTFVCASQRQALIIVQCLNAIQEGRSLDEVQQSGVFGYNPFGRNANSGSDNQPSGIKPMVTVAAAGGAHIAQELRQRTRLSRDEAQNERRGGSKSMRQITALSRSAAELTSRDLPILPSSCNSDSKRPSLLYMNLDDEQLSSRQPQRESSRGVHRGTSVDDKLRSFYEGEAHNDPSSEHSQDVVAQRRSSSPTVRNRATRAQTVYEPKGSDMLRQQLASAVQLKTPGNMRTDAADISRPHIHQRELVTSRSGYGLLSEADSDVGLPRPAIRQVKNHVERSPTDARVEQNPPTVRANFFYGFSQEDSMSAPDRPEVTPRITVQSRGPSKNLQNAGQPVAQPRVSTTPEIQSKPVAMVQPRKIQGIQVLPNPSAIQSSPIIKPPIKNTHQSRQSDNVEVIASPAKVDPPRVESRLKPIQPLTPSSNRRELKENKPNIKSSSNPDPKPGKRTQRPDETAPVADKTTDQQRLNRMKKDAEMASVAADMRLDFVPVMNTLSARGTNFEDALGYFP